MTDKETPTAERRNINIKEQLSLLSLLVFFVGIVSTETYYGVFNVKCQTLSLPVFHIIYRGLTAFFYNWFILGIYLLAALWLALQNVVVATVSKKHSLLASMLPFLFIVLVVSANYPLARYSGNAAAKADMYEATCTLPKVISISGLIWHWMIPSMSYSTGSSAVISLVLTSLSSRSAE